MTDLGSLKIACTIKKKFALFRKITEERQIVSQTNFVVQFRILTIVSNTRTHLMALVENCATLLEFF